MDDQIKIEDLPEGQQEYVKEYQRILHGLADVLEGIEQLQATAKTLTEELNELRAKERAEFGDNNVL
jgi:predicted house-cleaning noncanonical NTP pyrophosphatase (MazG superfamily)